LKALFVGDIHGDDERMLGLVGDLPPDVHLVAVGDYFDRWNRGLESIRWLMGRPNTVSLLGNHDALMLAVLLWRPTGIFAATGARRV